MPQLFDARTNAIVRTVLIAGAVFIPFVTVAVWAFARTPAATGQYRTFVQPVPFAHGMHVNGLKIDCRYCHAAAERGAAAGLPPTAACVPCHLDSMLRSNVFTAVRRSIESGRPIPWVRVNRLPDFVFFNHAVHVQNGVACDTCHGPIESMQQVYQVAPLTMEWCVQCHQSPERYISGTATRVAGWSRGDVARGRVIAARFDIERLTSCTTCHR